MRRCREYSEFMLSSRTGRSAAAIVLATVCLAIVCSGILGHKSNSNQSNSQSLRGGYRATDESELEPARTRRQPKATNGPVAAVQRVGNAAQSAVRVAATKSTSDAAITEPPKLRIKQVEAHLEFGEFGPALDIAKSSSDAIERTRLLQTIVQTQMKLGEFDAALATIRHIPIPEQRKHTRGERATQLTFAGGTGADPRSLMELILNETEGPWDELVGEGGTMDFFDTGVRVTPGSVLAQLTREEHSGRIKALGISARVADLNDDMARASTLRLVSLTRLEKEVAQRLADGQPVVETMKRLAGLWQIRYVFVFPDENDIVIGGPAEGWRYNENGAAIGLETGKPTLQLDDLVTLLRTFAPGGTDTFGCSINPRQEGLKRLMEYARQSSAKGPLRAGAQVCNYVRNLQQELGMQDIVLDGIPETSRIARVIVEADYRMKLIGLGQHVAGSHVPSYFDLMTVAEQKQGTTDVLRWWLTMKYDRIVHSPDRGVFEIQGASVLCQSTNQFVTSQGKQIDTGKAEATNRLFAQNFTNRYEELAQRDPIFADLQNVFDEALVAALLHHERIADRIGWDLGVFAPGAAYRPAEYEPPREVDSVVEHRVYHGQDIVVQVAGGVRANVGEYLKNDALVKISERLEHFADKGRAPQLPEGRWWWDTAN